MSAWIALAVVVASAAMDNRVRDLTVEQPFAAGFFYGLSLGMCRGCRHGNGLEPAGPHDPFAMSQWSRETLRQNGRIAYWFGSTIGGSLTILTVGGVFFRRLNTLSVRGRVKGLETSVK